MNSSEAGSVLIVDDDALFARATQRMLKQHFATVRVAYTVAAAFLAISSAVPECVVTDFDIEDTSTEGFIRTIADKWPCTRVVLYSASCPERWMPLVDAGIVKAAVAKPCVQSKELITAIGVL